MTRLLIALSTVSYACNHVAQPRLYRTICFDNTHRVPSHLQLLLRALGQKPQLGGSVREINLKSYGLFYTEGTQVWEEIARVTSLSPNLLNDQAFLGILRSCTSLEELAMSMCRSITSQGLRNVLPFLKHLRKLDVSYCSKIDDDCIRDIPRLCPLIEDLDLWVTSVTRTGMSFLLERAGIWDSDMQAILDEKPPHVRITCYDRDDDISIPGDSDFHESSDDSNLDSDEDDAEDSDGSD
ncbi:hypothetical protein DFS34DRAFT_688016 [Phlyctochytrium arcticum]|nr:hypothetical protein DFS34DRAFT_688016 [Phlyctochytrium arcticum]